MGTTTPFIVRLDANDPGLDQYSNIQYKDGWHTIVGPRKGLSAIYNEFLGLQCDWYGILADDIIPETQEWDVRLIDAAGKDGVAYGDDGINGKNRATHFAIGGSLVRELG